MSVNIVETRHVLVKIRMNYLHPSPPQVTALHLLLHLHIPFLTERTLPRHRACARGKRASGQRAKIGRAHLNSSHQIISYAVFCLKKKKNTRSVRVGGDKYDEEIVNYLLCNYWMLNGYYTAETINKNIVATIPGS